MSGQAGPAVPCTMNHRRKYRTLVQRRLCCRANFKRTNCSPNFKLDKAAGPTTNVTTRAVHVLDCRPPRSCPALAQPCASSWLNVICALSTGSEYDSAGLFQSRWHRGAGQDLHYTRLTLTEWPPASASSSSSHEAGSTAQVIRGLVRAQCQTSTRWRFGQR